MLPRLALRSRWLGLSTVFLLSCASVEPGGISSSECQPAQRRCRGSSIEECSPGGVFQTQSVCTDSQLCDDTLGCVACIPNTSVCASNNTEVRTCAADGTIGALEQSCSFGQICQRGTCVDACEVAASEFVYVVDVNYNFLSFEPRIDSDPQALKLIGKLSCSTTATPFSMAVDRKARAWVLYSDGSLYFVNPQDASCTASGYMANQMGFSTFGMGFASDSTGSRSETLYVGNNQGGTRGLGRIDPSALMLAKFADFPPGVAASPEMTGTGAAELYGYFPSELGNQHMIVRINKTSGQFDTTWQLDPLPGTPSAWAFAHWGGRYYQFVTSAGKNQIRRYDPATGTNVVVQDSTSYPIVGAGVSTCAPYIPG